MPPLDTAPDSHHLEGAPESAPHPRSADHRAALLRLGALLAALVAVGAVFLAGGLVGPERIRGWLDPLGAAAPLLFIPLCAVLGTLFVPGAALAAAGGLLFGPWIGLVCSLAAGTLAALLSREVSGRAGRESFDVVAGDRVQALAAFARRHGILAVIVARLAPWLPDAPVNHAFGVVGLPARTVAIGHVIAAGPRAFAYALIGSEADDPTGSTALIGWGINLTTGLVGTVLLAWVVLRERKTGRLSGNSAREATGE